MTVLDVPAIGSPRPFKAPRVADDALKNGLRVLVVRKPSVPRAEIRLLTPLGGGSNKAVERVIAKALTAGTSKRSSVEIAELFQRLGATFVCGTSADHFQVIGSVLSARLRDYLALLAELLTDASFPDDEVVLERGRVVQELQIQRSQPQVLAIEALRRRLFGKHRYATVLPTPESVARVGKASLHNFRTTQVGPKGAVLIVVGDVQPQRVLDAVGDTLGAWRTRVAASDEKAPPPLKKGPLLIIDRPGSVQTNIRLAGSIPSIADDETYALEVANTIFGGYFISRLTDNLRERRGYTYGPHSVLNHLKDANYFETMADVGADVTAPSLVETWYELGRMAALEVEESELVSAQRYLTGIQSLRIQSQAGLAAILAALKIYGLDIDYLKAYPKRINAVTAADVREASMKYLAPSRLVTVLVGDASKISPAVEALHDVKVSSA